MQTRLSANQSARTILVTLEMSMELNVSEEIIWKWLNYSFMSNKFLHLNFDRFRDTAPLKSG